VDCHLDEGVLVAAIALHPLDAERENVVELLLEDRGGRRIAQVDQR